MSPHSGWYTYGMRKTTVYLDEGLKADLARIAQEEDRSEADLIREALREAVARRTAPRPRLPLFDSGPNGDPTLAERVDEALAGGPGTPAFGER